MTHSLFPDMEVGKASFDVVSPLSWAEGKIVADDDFAKSAGDFMNRLIIGAVVGIAKGAWSLASHANGWREQDCDGCGRVRLRYNIKQHPNGPYFCTNCAETRAADMFRRELIPSGWESSLIGNVQAHKDHSTMTFRGKGTDGATYTVSWDKHGRAHWTDLGILDQNDPRRHRDPR